jgi:hypothetical protein
MKSQTAYTNLRKAMAFAPVGKPVDRKRIYVNFEGQDPVEVITMQAAWDVVKQNRQWELESIEEWEA